MIAPTACSVGSSMFQLRPLAISPSPHFDGDLRAALHQLTVCVYVTANTDRRVRRAGGDEPITRGSTACVYLRVADDVRQVGPFVGMGDGVAAGDDKPAQGRRRHAVLFLWVRAYHL